MQTSNPVSTSKYFLGTGPKEYYYTLWRELIIHAVPGTNIGGAYWYYLGNLSHEYEPAVAKATQRTGQTAWEQFDVSDYKRVQGPDFTLDPSQVTFTFGKYNGRSLQEILDEDINYVFFLAFKSDWTPSQTKHTKVLGYIRGMFRQAAEQADTERKEKIAADRAARDAARADLPAFDGRVTIEGTVLSTKFVENNFGGSLKFLVEHATGWKVWGTVPAAICSINESQQGNGHTQRGIAKGDVVRFTASVQKSDRDPKFGFFSRGSKASIVKPFQGTLDGVKDGYTHVILDPLPELTEEQLAEARERCFSRDQEEDLTDGFSIHPDGKRRHDQEQRRLAGLRGRF